MQSCGRSVTFLHSEFSVLYAFLKIMQIILLKLTLSVRLFEKMNRTAMVFSFDYIWSLEL